jgi:hypothetical protein
MEELYEWEQYSLVEPFGSPAEDDRVRLQCSLAFKLGAARGSVEPDWLDRNPEETARRRATISVADKIDAYFSGKSTDTPPDTSDELHPSAEDALEALIAATALVFQSRWTRSTRRSSM